MSSNQRSSNERSSDGKTQRDKIKMSEEEIHDFLVDSRTMILVSNGNDGYPHALPMWYVVDDENTVHMTTFRKSQKVRNLKRDRKASLLVESGDEYQALKGVLLYADGEIVDDHEVTTEVIFNISVARGDLQAGQKEAVWDALAKRAEKRVALRFRPHKIISWDHALSNSGP